MIIRVRVFFLSSGLARVMIRSISGRETILRDIDAGAFFGELAAIDGRGDDAKQVCGLIEAALRTVGNWYASLTQEQVLELAYAFMPDRGFRDGKGTECPPSAPAGWPLPAVLPRNVELLPAR